MELILVNRLEKWGIAPLNNTIFQEHSNQSLKKPYSVFPPFHKSEPLEKSDPYQITQIATFSTYG